MTQDQIIAHKIDELRTKLGILYKDSRRLHDLIFQYPSKLEYKRAYAQQTEKMRVIEREINKLRQQLTVLLTF